LSGASTGEKKGEGCVTQPVENFLVMFLTVVSLLRVLQGFWGIHWNIELSADPDRTLEYSLWKERSLYLSQFVSSLMFQTVSLCWKVVQGDEDLCRVNCTIGNFLLSLQVAILIMSNPSISRYEIC
jgi:hypothetical protein